MIGAVVPVKALAAAKTRLLPDVSERDRERLALAMLEDILAALLAVPELVRVVVATPDARAADAARAAGAEVWVRPDPGVDASVEAASAQAAPGPDDGVLVVLGDVAGARPEDLEAILAAGRGLGRPSVVLAPSNDGGTSALLRVPRDVIPVRYGPDSAKRHRELAADAGARYRELPLPSLAVDVDRSDDLRALLASDAPAPRTRRLLAELGFGSGVGEEA